MNEKDIEQKTLDILKKSNPIDELTDLCKNADSSREMTKTYIWIRIWEVANKNNWLIPFLNEFKKPAIPKNKIIKCAVEVKELIPETPYRDIIRNVLEFVER